MTQSFLDMSKVKARSLDLFERPILSLTVAPGK